jgi:protoheme IX farnesyltransferase
VGSRVCGRRGDTIESIGTEYVAREESPRFGEKAAALFRLSKPGIVAAVLLAGFTGMVLGGKGWPDGMGGFICLSALFLSAAGSAMMNGVLDAPLDQRMARLRKRTSALETAGRNRVTLLAMAGIGLAMIISLRFLGTLVSLLIAAAVISYTLLYTLRLKRCSPWGAVPGGIPGALPVLIGYAAAAHRVGPDAIILFLVMLLWQPPHFWALALGCCDDYRNAGVPVLPVTHGERLTITLIFIHGAALVPATLSLWLFGYCSIFYAAFALACGIAFLSACYIFLVRRKRSDIVFSASILYLLLLFAAIVTDICYIQGQMP